MLTPVVNCTRIILSVNIFDDASIVTAEKKTDGTRKPDLDIKLRLLLYNTVVPICG